MRGIKPGDVLLWNRPGTGKPRVSVWSRAEESGCWWVILDGRYELAHAKDLEPISYRSRTS